MPGLSSRPDRGIYNPRDAFESPTFDSNVRIPVNPTVGAASISPCGRDVALGSREGLHIVDLDNIDCRPRHLVHRSRWDVADVQWSPFASRYYWIVSTSNQKALVWNLEMKTDRAPIEFTLHAHSRAITDINFSAHHPDILSTCAVDSYVHCWDLRTPAKPAFTFADWNSGATQVKWNRQESHIIASAHDRFLHIWDDRNGTFPLHTIDAHQTKIYGVDWSRVCKTGIITCSLDHTIKLWRYDSATGDEPTKPDRTIETDYPVWRARHTPFGDGLLAMPQRGASQLQLFRQTGSTEPTVTFRGHRDQVKEFLWRSRGGVYDGADHRDFQLVSLGRDHNLVLHKITAEHLATVGHTYGMPAVETLNFTRYGAEYQTYGSAPLIIASRPRRPCPEVRPSLTGPTSTTTTTTTTTAVTTEPMSKRIHDQLASRCHRTSLPSLVFCPVALLQAELTSTKLAFPEVIFHKTKLRKRTVTISLPCRWDRTHSPAVMKVKIRFPVSYPRIKGPDFVFKKVPIAMSNAALMKLHRDLDTIAEHYRCRRIGSLDVVISFLLGRRTLKEAVDGVFVGHAIDRYYSSGGVPGDDLDFNIGPNRNRRAGIGCSTRKYPTLDPPPPKTCGARFTPDGQIICFFVRRPPGKESRDRDGGAARRADTGADSDIHVDTDSDSDSDSDDSSRASSAGSSDIDDLVNVDTSFFLLSPWRRGPGQLPGSTGSESDTCLPIALRPRNVSVVSIRPIDDNAGLTPAKSISIIPGSRQLGKSYLIFGNSATVCKHNSRVALEAGFVDIAAAWNLAGLAIQSQIPVQFLYGDTGGSVGSPSPAVGLRCRDRGSNEENTFGNHSAFSRALSRTSLDGHASARPWVVDQLFGHYERLADVQMLAMLSCVFISSNFRFQRHDGGVGSAGGGGGDSTVQIDSSAHTQFDRPPRPRPSTKPTGRSGPVLSFSRLLANGGSVRALSSGLGSGSSAGPGSVMSLGPTPSMASAKTGISNTSGGSGRVRSGARESPMSASPSPARLGSRPLAAGSDGGRASPSVGVVDTARPVSCLSTPAGSISSLVTPARAAVASVSWGGVRVFGDPSSSSSSPASGSTRGRGQPGSRTASGSTPIGPSGLSSGSTATATTTTATKPTPVVVVAPPTQPRAGRGPAVTLKNQERFDNGGFCGTSLLDRALFRRAFTYRHAYASMLEAWGLSTQAGDVLYFNAAPGVVAGPRPVGTTTTVSTATGDRRPPSMAGNDGADRTLSSSSPSVSRSYYDSAGSVRHARPTGPSVPPGIAGGVASGRIVGPPVGAATRSAVALAAGRRRRETSSIQ